MDVVATNFEQVHRPALPAESPLEMPVQSLWHCSKPRSDRTRLPSAPRGMAFRRLLVIGGTVLLTAAAANEMYKVLTAGTLTVLAILVLLLFVALFAWIALALTSAICGFACMLGRGDQRLGISSGGKTAGGAQDGSAHAASFAPKHPHGRPHSLS